MQSAIGFIRLHQDRFPYTLRRVIGESMYPALEAGQLIMIRRSAQYHAGDVVVFKRKGSERIKRVSGVEGDFLYVLGDNPLYSKDSRHYGYVPITSVLGKVILPRI